VAEALVVTSSPGESFAVQWLALSLTEGLGPKRGRSLVERLGGVQNVFRASLTEVEAAGIRAVSAQSLATGRSTELAHDELGRATTAGVSVICWRIPRIPQSSRKSTTHPCLSRCAEM
jgi:DNA processing protein